MSWDGIYRARRHYRAVDSSGKKAARVACGRRFAKTTTSKIADVSCFVCLKKLGVIK